MTRVVAGACALGVATGWNIANTGAIAQALAADYGVSLATIGLFTTAIFLVHMLMQVPGGRASDRFGPRRMGLLGLVLLALLNAAALLIADAALAIGLRLLMGIGTGLGFVAGADYVRSQGGSAAAQGLYGGAGIAGGGLALAVVPQVEGWLGWRAPWWTAVVAAVVALSLLWIGPRDLHRAAHVHDGPPPPGIFRDHRLYRLGVMYAASFGLSVVAGNWIVTLLERNGDRSKGLAGAVAALALLLGMITRPLGGWLMRRRPGRMRAVVAASIVACGAGSLLLAVAEPLAASVLGATLIGLAAGLPFAPAFLGAAHTRPDAPATAIGFVNGAAALAIVVGSPLLGLGFSLPGDGRLGFALLAGVWLTALVALPSRQELGVVAPQPAK